MPWFRVFLALGLLVAGCQRGDDAPPVPFETLFDLRVGDHGLQAWVAVEQAEQQRGLMFRDSLPSNTGMLFVFRVPEQRAFWMRNTSIPLDIGYFAPDGTLRSVHPLFPFDERSVPSTTADIQFALEMERGWFARHGIRPGHKLDLDLVSQALKARGYEPFRFIHSAP